MEFLAISASTQRASLALGVRGESFFTLHNHRPQGHSEFLNIGVEALLNQRGKKISDINCIGVDIGPGSFTGVRAAVNLARTLGYGLKKPIVVKTSLELLAMTAPQKSVIAINAYKNLLFTYWSTDISPGPKLMSLKEFGERLSKETTSLFAVGDAFLQYWDFFPTQVRAQLVRTSEFDDFPDAGKFFQSEANSPGTFDWNSVIPLYVRPSSAEEVLSEKQRLKS